jgi:hypothetical protein
VVETANASVQMGEASFTTTSCTTTACTRQGAEVRSLRDRSLRRALQVKPSVEQAMRERRLRPTFLLQITVLAVCLAIFAAAFFFFESTGPRIGVVLALLFVWVIGMELELLPIVLQEVALVIAGGAAREGCVANLVRRSRRRGETRTG